MFNFKLPDTKSTSKPSLNTINLLSPRIHKERQTKNIKTAIITICVGLSAYVGYTYYDNTALEKELVTLKESEAQLTQLDSEIVSLKTQLEALSGDSQSTETTPFPLFTFLLDLSNNMPSEIWLRSIETYSEEQDQNGEVVVTSQEVAQQSVPPPADPNAAPTVPPADPNATPADPNTTPPPADPNAVPAVPNAAPSTPDSSGFLIIKGASLNMATVGQFLAYLNKQDVFESVELYSVHEYSTDSEPKRTYVAYSMKCKIAKKHSLL